MEKEEIKSSNEEKCCQVQTNLNLSEFGSFKIEERTNGGIKLDIAFPKIKLRLSPSHLFKIKGKKK